MIIGCNLPRFCTVFWLAMLNSAGRAFLIVLLAPVLCIGVVVMFVAALCDFCASRLRVRFQDSGPPMLQGELIQSQENVGEKYPPEIPR
jgi:hypothetical protein